MSTPAPPTVVEAFASAGLRNVVPVAPSATPGAASYDLGFPALTMTPLASGGIPPGGRDFNGVLYDATAHTAWLAAGGQYHWSAAIVAAVGGYGIGAIVQSLVTPTTFFLNMTADNINDPDSDSTGWIAYSPAGATSGLQIAVPPVGPSHNYPLDDGAGFLDVNPSAGSVNFTGVTAGFDGQLLTVTNVHASNSVTLNALNGGSSAANQFRMAADITLLQYASANFRYSTVLGFWVGTP